MEYSIGLESETHIRVQREDLGRIVDLLIDGGFTITIPRNRAGKLITFPDKYRRAEALRKVFGWKNIELD